MKLYLRIKLLKVIPLGILSLIVLGLLTGCTTPAAKIPFHSREEVKREANIQMNMASAYK